MAIYVRDQELYNFIISQLNFTLHVLFFGRNADWVIEWDPEEWNRPTLKELEKQRTKAEEMYNTCIRFIQGIKQNSEFDRKNLKEVYRYIIRLNNILDFLDNRIEEEEDKRKKEKDHSKKNDPKD